MKSVIAYGEDKEYDAEKFKNTRSYVYADNHIVWMYRQMVAQTAVINTATVLRP